MPPPDAIIEAAESHWKRGRFEAAWAHLEDLPAIERAMPAVLDLRCRLCIALERWELGHEVAAVLASAVDAEHHVTAAEFCVAHAQHLVAEASYEGARNNLVQAVKCWPAIRDQIVADDDLAWVYLCP